MALAALIFVFWGHPTAAVTIVIAVLLLVALGLIELIGRPPTTPRARAPRPQWVTVAGRPLAGSDDAQRPGRRPGRFVQRRRRWRAADPVPVVNPSGKSLAARSWAGWARLVKVGLPGKCLRSHASHPCWVMPVMRC